MHKPYSHNTNKIIFQIMQSITHKVGLIKDLNVSNCSLMFKNVYLNKIFNKTHYLKYLINCYLIIY